MDEQDGTQEAAGESTGSGDGDPRAGSAEAGEEGNELERMRAELEAAQQREQALEARLSELEGALAEATARAAELREQHLEALARALRAEHAGAVVPELIQGSSARELEASVERARAAFRRAVEAARRELAGQQVPAGNPAREQQQAAALEGLSAVAKIAHGLSRT